MRSARTSYVFLLLVLSGGTPGAVRARNGDKCNFYGCARKETVGVEAAQLLKSTLGEASDPIKSDGTGATKSFSA